MSRCARALFSLYLTTVICCAAEQPPTAPEPGAAAVSALKFDEGIGLYWAAEGVSHFLYFPDEIDSATSFSEIPSTARFFAYGLDFADVSALGFGPLTPHQGGYGFSYRDADGEYQGRYAAHFIPLEGYSVPVYEIVGPYWFERLRADEIPYRYWSFEVPSSGSREGYSFRFATEAFVRAREEMQKFLGSLLNDASTWHDGTITSRTLIFDPSPTDFQIRFLEYQPESARVLAEVQGLTEDEVHAFEGKLISPWRLTLHHKEREVTWDLEIDQRTMKGSYGTGFAQHQVSIKLSSGDPSE